MKKGFVCGFVAALVLILIVGGAFMLGKGSASKEDSKQTESTNSKEETSVDTKENETQKDNKDEDAQDNINSTEDSKDEDSVRIVAGENWMEGDTYCSKYEVFIKNTKDKKVTEWKVSFMLPEGCELGDFWNGDLTIENNELTAVPMDYNKEIEAEAEVSFGFIIRSDEEFDLNKSSKKTMMNY